MTGKLLVLGIGALLVLTPVAEAHQPSLKAAKRIAEAEARDYAFGTKAHAYGRVGKCKRVSHAWRCRVYVEYGDISDTSISSEYCEWRVTVNHRRRARNGRKRCTYLPASDENIQNGIDRGREGF